MDGLDDFDDSFDEIDFLNSYMHGDEVNADCDNSTPSTEELGCEDLQHHVEEELGEEIPVVSEQVQYPSLFQRQEQVRVRRHVNHSQAVKQHMPSQDASMMSSMLSSMLPDSNLVLLVAQVVSALQSQQNMNPNPMVLQQAVQNQVLLQNQSKHTHGNNLDSPCTVVEENDFPVEKFTVDASMLTGSQSFASSAKENSKPFPSRTSIKPSACADVKSSRFCHICSRRAADVRQVACGNLEFGCRKVVCEKCFDDYGWSFESALKEDSGFLCTHCIGKCPDKAQCKLYKKQPSVKKSKQPIIKKTITKEEKRPQSVVIDHPGYN